jgi:proteasome lid subunit RPN8/RPN11
MINLSRRHLDELIAHAREAAPEECCGLMGGDADGRVMSVYRLVNAAEDRLTGYEARAEDLFEAFREMRKRNEELLAIYHSHPRSDNPEPSPVDVSLAYYPLAAYFIIGLGAPVPVCRCFQIKSNGGSWTEIRFAISV